MLTWYSAGYLNYLNATYKNVLVLIEPELFYDTFSALQSGGEFIDEEPRDDSLIKIKVDNYLYSFLAGEFPFLNYLYEALKNDPHVEQRIYSQLWLEFQKVLEKSEETEPLALFKYQSILTYAYRLALWDFMLRPSFYHLVKSVKMFTNDTIALHFLKFGLHHPLNDNEALEEDYDLDLMDKILSDQVKNIFPYPQRQMKEMKFQVPPPKPQQKVWKEDWSNDSGCSWPPEDLVIENFRQYVYSNSLELANLQRTKVEEFQGSLKDGIDFRETLRKFHLGKIFVKEEFNRKAQVGAKILVFDQDFKEYPYRATWYAEHPYESTISFYSTNPEDEMVGPGIAKSKYGGLLMLFPPLAIPNIWTDPFFKNYHNPLEKITLAGIIYSQQKYIAYIADQPPQSHIFHWAKKYKKTLVYIPISEFSHEKLNRIRYFHYLQDKNLRSIAEHFIP